MVELNKYGFYSLNCGILKEQETDKVDKCIDFLKLEDDYEKVQSYLREHFGTFESDDKWFEFEDINKTCYLSVKDNKIEFCAQKNHKDYFGKGWIKIKKD